MMHMRSSMSFKLPPLQVWTLVFAVLLFLFFIVVFYGWHRQLLPLLKAYPALPELVLGCAAGLVLMLTLMIRQFHGMQLQARALAGSEDVFRCAMEYAHTGMALLSPDCRWIKVNPALVAMSGYTEEELMLQELQTLTHPEDFQAEMEALPKLLSGEINHVYAEKRCYHKSGTMIWVLCVSSVARHRDGSPKYIIMHVMDITERKEMDRMKREFISVVSHELRTPLTSIRASLGLIIGVHGENLPEKVQRMVQIAHSNCERLILLINDILDIEKLSAGQMRYTMKAEKLAMLLDQAVESMRPFGDKYKVEFVMEPIASDCMVEVDAARFMQVVSNLLSNAAKFSFEGGKVIVRAQIVKGWIRISFQDFGPGIPLEFHNRIFEKFSQADASASRHNSGTGLGLHISREMIERMKGRIGFDTELGKGAVFWIELACAPEGTCSLPVLEITPNELLKPRILHVEDDADLSHVLGEALIDDAEVITASSISTADFYLKNNAFSLVVLDVSWRQW